MLCGEMRVEMLRTILTAGLFVSAGAFLAAAVTADDISARAKKLHFSCIVVDTPADTTQRFLDGRFDIGERSSSGSIDVPRMREGGLGAIFFSIWVPSKGTGPEQRNNAIAQSDAQRGEDPKHPED